MSKITLNELKTIDLKKLKRVDLAGLIYDVETQYLNQVKHVDRNEFIKRHLNGVGCAKGFKKDELIDILSRRIEKAEAVQEKTIVKEELTELKAKFTVKKLFNKTNNDSSVSQLVLMVDKNGNELITYGAYIWKATIERLEQLQEITIDKFDKNRFMKYWLKLHNENMIDFSEVESVQEDEELKELLNGDDSFRYMMIDRLLGDCRYYLGYGDRCTSNLWAKDENKQIKYIKALYNSFDNNKPNFITIEDILQIEKEMTDKEYIKNMLQEKLNKISIEYDKNNFLINQHMINYEEYEATERRLKYQYNNIEQQIKNL